MKREQKRGEDKGKEEGRRILSRPYPEDQAKPRKPSSKNSRPKLIRLRRPHKERKITPCRRCTASKTKSRPFNNPPKWYILLCFFPSGFKNVDQPERRMLNMQNNETQTNTEFSETRRKARRWSGYRMNSGEEESNEKEDGKRHGGLGWLHKVHATLMCTSTSYLEFLPLHKCPICPCDSMMLNSIPQKG